MEFEGLKMIKKTIILIIAVIMSFSLAACQLAVVSAEYDGESYGTYKSLGSLIMNAGETLTVSRSNFDGLGSNVKSDWSVGKFDRFELFVSDESREGVVTIKNNIITASNSGYTKVHANVYIRGKNPYGNRVMLKWTVTVAEIYAINEATMTPITTAQELADINNDLSGNYILKADIDLKEWGEWIPIGNTVSFDQQSHPSMTFTGMLVNPDGYEIKNLTITTKETTMNAGLFGEIGKRSFISGIKLEDVSIDLSDYSMSDYAAKIHPPWVGGIAAVTYGYAMIFNCSVSGTLIGGGSATGGIVGINQMSYIIGCIFIGKISGPQIDIWPAQVGGIAGTHHSIRDYQFWHGYIKDCNVYADINGYNIAETGGIIGYNGLEMGIANCFFEGTAAGRVVGKMIGYDAKTRDSIDSI